MKNAVETRVANALKAIVFCTLAALTLVRSAIAHPGVFVGKLGIYQFSVERAEEDRRLTFSGTYGSIYFFHTQWIEPDGNIQSAGYFPSAVREWFTQRRIPTYLVDCRANLRALPRLLGPIE